MDASRSFAAVVNTIVTKRPSINSVIRWGALVLCWSAMVASADVMRDRPTPCPELCTCPIRKHEGLTVNCSGVGNDRKLMLAILPRLTTNLSNLFFTKNKLDLIYFNKTLPGKIKNDLKLIDLSLNDLHLLLPNIFEEFAHLESLFLSRNYLQIIEPHSFKGLHNLRLLNLDNNRITLFRNGAFDGLLQLQDLSATGNALTSFLPVVLNPIPSLQQLYLDNNSLTSLDEGFLPRFLYFTFRNVHFRGNPLHCDCRLTWLAVWYRNQAMEEDKKSPVPTCSWPASSKGKSLITIPLSNFTCSATKSLYSECNNSTFTNNSVAEDSARIQTIKPCYSCSRGFYGAHVNSLRELYCQPCALFETSLPGSTLPSQCHCRSGFFRDSNNNCTPCHVGMYKPRAGDEGACLSCANGSSTHTNGAATCDCKAGYYMERGSCLECARSTYKSYSGPHRSGPYGCFQCSEARSSPPASTSVQQCVCLAGTLNDSRNSCSIDLSKHPPQHPASVKQLISHGDEAYGSENHVIAVYVGGSLIFIIAAVAILRHILTRKRKQSLKKLELRAVNSFMPRMAVQDTGYTLPTDGWEIDIRQIALTRVLGEGAFGVVYEAMASGLLGTNEPTIVAVKTLRDECTAEERNALRSELEQLLYVGQHPNIVNLLGCVTIKGCFMLVMEYAQNGDLLSYLKSKKMVLAKDSKQSRSDEDDTVCEESAILRPKSDNGEAKDVYVMQGQLLSFAWQVSKGMNHLAGIKCIHRDLAARNVLLTDGWIVKITDFGLARAVYESGYYFKQSKGRLPFKWMAPEAILQGQYTVKSDIWSFGVLLWEMVTLGSTPYPGVPIHSLLDLLLSGYRMPKPQDCISPLYEIMASCWQEHPSERPTFDILMSKLETLLADVSNRDYLKIPGDGDSINMQVSPHRGTSLYDNDVSAPRMHVDSPTSAATPEGSSRERMSSYSND